MSSQNSNQSIVNAISQIIAIFSLLECDKCAIAVSAWLTQHKIPHKILKLKTKRPSDFFIICDRIPSNESITENGTHYGVEVLDKVYDNISTYGLPRQEWLRSFQCRSGKFTLEEIDSIQKPMTQNGN